MAKRDPGNTDVAAMSALSTPAYSSPSLLPLPLGIVAGLLAIFVVAVVPGWLPNASFFVVAGGLLLVPAVFFFAAGLLCWKYARSIMAGLQAGAIGGFLGGIGHTIAGEIPSLREVAIRIDAPIAGLLLLLVNATFSGFFSMFFGIICGSLGALVGTGLDQLQRRHQLS